MPSRPRQGHYSSAVAGAVRRFVVVALVALLLLVPRVARSEEGVGVPEGLLHWTMPLQCASDVPVTLPPGYYLPDATWDALDFEVRRLQDAETRLTAERDSYADTTVQWVVGALVAGFAAGALID